MNQMEFHVSRNARERYDFDETLFSLSGNVIFANFHAARQFAQKINERRDLIHFPERAVRAGQINAMGLIDEILHYVVSLYQQQKNPGAFRGLLDELDRELGREVIDQALSMFADEFPPMAVYSNRVDLSTYLTGQTEDTPNREILLEEMILLRLANANPAFAPYQELFDDTRLAKDTAYRAIARAIHTYFENQPHFGPEDQNLIEMLRSPAIAVPHSLSGQLDYIRSQWGYLIGQLLYRLLGSLDLIREEEKAIFTGPGPATVYEYAGLRLEHEQFSPDKDWMPQVVLIAKNAFVWLDQLSKAYNQEIRRLDQIPDEELNRLQKWGITGLWLIGLWERSRASQRIKQLCGNPEAVASAYSLLNYNISAELGGYDAYRNLRDRAWQRGIRLSSDMVPNHMGIDSQWLLEHPGWFIGQEYSPFPSYTFNGPDLSEDDRVGIYLEDHYYSRSDAAVVFKRVDNHSGDALYIYHGNDGTSTPWNDTAQLNFLNPEVREAVIQTILHVARMFPIIRFDAAMTLAKKHYQRLWFPEPGTGGAIPSRAEHGMSRGEFDSRMPVEFWREVVDRVAREVPDTLLLAEAFWLMEGYFVRTLGMHRVYNSAFMNMLRDELNANYRNVIKNTLEFDPEILKRFVNFMNNPDERTAIDQFGKEDKYFGICIMMVTMPGLPMFGHGQIEGFTEKYGMEYYRAYWDEQPDSALVERHERQIFPLLHRRSLFADVKHFQLYDLFTQDGHVNEDVFVYSNRHAGERALVVYHNKFAEARGWVRESTAYAVKASPAVPKSLTRTNLGEGLNLRNDHRYYCIFRDHNSGLEYLRNCAEIHESGLYLSLGAYTCRVFVDFHEVQDNEWHHYAQLYHYLDGRGVPSMEAALSEILLRPIHYPYRELINPGMLRWLADECAQAIDEEIPAEMTTEVTEKTSRLVQEVSAYTHGAGDTDAVTDEILREFGVVMRLLNVTRRLHESQTPEREAALAYLESNFNAEVGDWAPLFAWVFTHTLGKILDPADYEDLSRTWIDEWLLGKILSSTLQDLGYTETEARKTVTLVKLTTSHHRWSRDIPNKRTDFEILDELLRDSDFQQFLEVNRYQGILWFNKEALEQILWWLYVVGAVEILAEHAGSAQEISDTLTDTYQRVRRILEAAENAGYQLDRLLEHVKGKTNQSPNSTTSPTSLSSARS